MNMVTITTAKTEAKKQLAIALTVTMWEYYYHDNCWIHNNEMTVIMAWTVTMWNDYRYHGNY